MTHADLEKKFKKAGLDGYLLDDIVYQNSISELIATWESKIEEIQWYIDHAKKYDGELSASKKEQGTVNHKIK